MGICINAPIEWKSYRISYLPLHRSKYKQFEGSVACCTEKICIDCQIHDARRIYTFFVPNLTIFPYYREILLRFSVAYHSRTLTVPLNWLKKILSCSDTDEVIGLCKYYNISCDAATGSVKFNRPDFDLTRPIVSDFFCTTEAKQ